MVGDGDRVEVRMTRALDLDPFRASEGRNVDPVARGATAGINIKGIHTVSRI